MSVLVAVVDGEPVVEYDRSVDLAENQMAYLGRMDAQMDQGIPSGQGTLFAPDLEQRSQFVANQLMMALKEENEQLIAASMAYLAIRLPELKQVSAKNIEGSQQISLIYDKEFMPHQTIKFVKPEMLNS